MSHKCNFYCSSNVHAIQVFSTGLLTVDMVRTRLSVLNITIVGVFPAREANRDAFFNGEHKRLAVSSETGILYPEELNLDRFKFAYIVLILNNREASNNDTE